MAERSLRKEKRHEFLDKAIQLLKKCCELEPNLPSRWIDLAKAYERKRDFDNAIKCMEEAIKRRETPHWSMWEKLGDLYLRKNKKEKARECYIKAINARLNLKREG